MVPSEQGLRETCCMCGFPVEIGYDLHASGKPEYRTKKTECTNPACHARMYELKKFAAPGDEAEDEFELPIPHLKEHVNVLRCQNCLERTNKLFSGKSCLCCEKCLRGERK